jgi:GNAT superfamily N-acetyltransferase
MTDFAVRTAGPDTVDALVASVTALFHEDAGRHDPTRDVTWPTREGPAYYTGLLDDPRCLLALAWQPAAGGERPVGHLVGKLAGPSTMLLQPVAVLESIRVDPAVRGQGAGHRLVEAFLAWARAGGAAVTCVTAYAANERARRFYERHGFAVHEVTLQAPLPA